MKHPIAFKLSIAYAIWSVIIAVLGYVWSLPSSDGRGKRAKASWEKVKGGCRFHRHPKQSLLVLD